jgi:hypothetical protein
MLGARLLAHEQAGDNAAPGEEQLHMPQVIVNARL